MPVNDFRPFATMPGSNVVAQPNYVADPSTGVGFSAGIALSAKLNKVWRQSSAVSHALTQVASDVLGEDVLDDGDLAKLAEQLHRTLIKVQPKEMLSIATEFYINANTGSDTNDGRTPTTAFRTLTYAGQAVINGYNFNGNRVTMNVADGIYEGLTIGGMPLGLNTAFNWLWLGNISNPSACVIRNSYYGGAIGVWQSWVWLQGFRLEGRAINNQGGFGFGAFSASTIIYQNIDFGACDFVHILYSATSYGGPTGAYTISGGSYAHLLSSSGSIWGCPPSSPFENPVTVSIINNPTINIFAMADLHSLIAVMPNHLNFAGGCTGTRHSSTNGSVISIPNADVNFFPGTVAGYPGPLTWGQAPDLALAGWNTFGLLESSGVPATGP